MTKTHDLAHRLEQIRVTCRYPSQNALTEALGEHRQQWANWCRRGSVGRADLKLRQLTGVSIDWLKTGEGEPFPEGPRLFAGLDPAHADLDRRVHQLESELDQLTASLANTLAFLRSQFPEHTQGLHEYLAKRAPARPDQTPALAAILHAAAAGQTKPRDPA